MVYNMSHIRDSLAPGRAQNLLCRSALLMSMFLFLGNVDVKSAFALLLAKVTKPPLRRRKEYQSNNRILGGDAYKTNNQRNVR